MLSESGIVCNNIFTPLNWKTTIHMYTQFNDMMIVHPTHSCNMEEAFNVCYTTSCVTWFNYTFNVTTCWASTEDAVSLLWQHLTLFSVHQLLNAVWSSSQAQVIPELDTRQRYEDETEPIRSAVYFPMRLSVIGNVLNTSWCNRAKCNYETG